MKLRRTVRISAFLAIPLLGLAVAGPASATPHAKTGLESCKSHLNDLKYSSGELLLYTRVECTQPEDIQINTWMQYYTTKWVNATPGGYVHETNSVVVQSFTRDCHGGTYTHWRAVAKVKVDGVSAPTEISANETKVDCGK